MGVGGIECLEGPLVPFLQGGGGSELFDREEQDYVDDVAGRRR